MNFKRISTIIASVSLAIALSSCAALTAAQQAQLDTDLAVVKQLAIAIGKPYAEKYITAQVADGKMSADEAAALEKALGQLQVKQPKYKVVEK